MPDHAAYISGCHSDPDPSPGLGIARSLRSAFPHLRLTGIDYSVRSSGLHAADFNHIQVHPVWGEMDLETYASQVQSVLADEDACWISGLDVEVDWLASNVGPHPRLLIPPVAAQREVRKPKLNAAARLGMQVPPTVPADASPEELHRLGRRAGWRTWVKGMYHEAYPATSFAELGRQIERMRQHWPTEQLSVQGHVAGLERAYAFAAYQGRLLDIVQVEKRVVTGQGKTWAASVTQPSEATAAKVASFVAEVGWTGGGEIEFVRTARGEEWLLDFNPRFPAYIHGVTICGVNLPGLLIAAALGVTCPKPPRSAAQFIRVVQEIAVRAELPLPPLNTSSSGGATVGKHPSFQPELVRRMTGRPGRNAETGASKGVGQTISAWPENGRKPDTHTRRVRDPHYAGAVLDEVARAVAGLPPRPVFTPALSIKTDPHPALVRHAAAVGWWAEVISGEELSWATAQGFDLSRMVYNGPVPAHLLGPLTQPLAAVFADSVESFQQVVGRGLARVVGIRLRLPSHPSRFGIDVADYSAFSRTLSILRTAVEPYGVHFHVSADTLGPTRWDELADEALTWAGVIADTIGRPPVVLDIGGGWHADDFRDVFLPALGLLHARVRDRLPGVERVVFEPGKAVAGSTATLTATVLEVRPQAKPAGAIDVVVDVSVADLPMAPLYAHPMRLHRGGRSLGPLGGGFGRVLGSICMENDILAWGVSFPVVPQPGDTLVIAAAGGYNASMAWSFAAGVSRDG